MANPDPALGIGVDFPSQGFRDAITFAMQMGLNPDPARRPKFVFKSTARTYWKDDVQLASPPRLDRDGKPLDPDIDVRPSPDTVVSVDCAIEVDRADADELPVGNFRPSKVIATLLDDQYAQVQGCDEMIYNGDRYVYGYEPESNGLFDVGVYTIIFYAINDS